MKDSFKQWFILISLVVMILFLTSCYEGRGYAYKNLNDLKVGAVHGAYENVPDTNGSSDDETVYDSLSKNLCGTNPHCCDEFTDEERAFFDLEHQAVVENNPRLCLDLPEEDLIVDCPYEEPYVYYSKSRCLELVADNN